MNDNYELLGLPPIPKKRGRPATGKAKTPAERKREQRERLDSWLQQQVIGPEDFFLLTLPQLCQALPLLVSRGDIESAIWCNQAISRELQTASRLACN